MPGFATFRTVGFSGSRSLSGPAWRRCRALAAAAASSPGVSVATGCAGGADRAAREGFRSVWPYTGIIFRAEAVQASRPGLPWPAALAIRSVRFVRHLAGSPAPCLISFPGGPCPPRLGPARSWPSGFGSGSWQTLALAVGLGVPVFVFVADGQPA